MASAKPAPFLTRLYDMVSDPSTDYAIAWNTNVSVQVSGAPAGRVNAFTVHDSARRPRPMFRCHCALTLRAQTRRWRRSTPLLWTRKRKQLLVALKKPTPDQ